MSLLVGASAAQQIDEEQEATYELIDTDTSSSALGLLETTFNQGLQNYDQYYDYFYALAVSKDVENRKKAIDLLIRMKSPSSHSTLLLAKTLYSINDYERARDYAEGLLRSHPDDSRIKTLWQATCYRWNENKQQQQQQQQKEIVVGVGIGVVGVGAAILLSYMMKKK